MLFAALCIVLNVLIVVLFKLFDRYQIHVLQAIVINYLTCTVLGLALVSPSKYFQVLSEIPAWLPYTTVLGFVFIFGFNITAHSVAKEGLAITIVAQRISFIGSILFGIIIFQEKFNFFSIIGSLTAIVAVIFLNFRDKMRNKAFQISSFLPFIVFVTSAIIEMTIFYLTKKGLTQSGDYMSTITIFFTACILGLIYTTLIRPVHWKTKNIMAGIALGVPNFYSIYTLFQALGSTLPGSVIIPTINLFVIFLGSIMGFIFFNEKLNNYKKMGFALTILSFILLFWSL